MKLIVDAQLPPTLAGALRRLGYEAWAATELGLRAANDTVTWEYALQEHAVILTKNEDFADRCLRSTRSPVVVWLRIGNTTNSALAAWLLSLLPAVMRYIEAGDTLTEVRRT